ncbi:MAG: P1 family peptidase [Cytophagaceae bacterium]|nr:P1 family peptidase [Cytophagaceae bacterium]MBK9933364.1 P1 family peptidase [Cytophagaceae bacterium]MBL0302920.1 P1 family peptidase [Cytophagaceae bacterium]
MKYLIFPLLFILNLSVYSQKKRPSEYGIKIGILPAGKLDAITDVPGVKVGHFTLHQGKDIHTGATTILPHSGNIFNEKVPAAIFVGNGFGKLAGYTQVEELGTLETPILLTNTLAVAQGMEALIDYTFSFPENDNVRSVNAVVGETNDGGLNDIRRRVLTRENMLEALKNAKTGKVEEGNVGAGSGTMCFGFKGGIGTSSRVLPKSKGAYTVGVLVQSNFGGILKIAGKEVGVALGKHKYTDILKDYEDDGSCMMVVATDAPLDAKSLKRLAARAMLGLGRTGGVASHGSGDYVIAFSTAESVRINTNDKEMLETHTTLKSQELDILFEAVIEATEEAIINSLFAAETVEGHRVKAEALPVEKVLEIIKKPPFGG